MFYIDNNTKRTLPLHQVPEQVAAHHELRDAEDQG